MNSVSLLLRRVLNLIYPLQCFICGSPIPVEKGGYVCDKCKESFVFLKGEEICQICGKPQVSSLCWDCRQNVYSFDRARSVALYEGNWREMIHLFKYRNFPYLSSFFAPYLEEALSFHPFLKDVDLIIPVPLHWKEKWRRGYNQSLLLARQISRITGIEVREDLLFKKRNTPSQVSLSAEERRRNVKGVFSVRRGRELKGRRVLLVDDVFTTGATVNECAKVLKERGVEKVFVLTLARGE